MFGSALLQPARSVCVSSERFFILYVRPTFSVVTLIFGLIFYTIFSVMCPTISRSNTRDVYFWYISCQQWQSAAEDRATRLCVTSRTHVEKLLQELSVQQCPKIEEREVCRGLVTFRPVNGVTYRSCLDSLPSCQSSACSALPFST